MPPHPNWSVRFAEPITQLPPLFPRSIPPAPRRTMAQDMDLEELFTKTSDYTGLPTEPAICLAETVSADASTSQNNTTSRRLRPRRAKPTTTPASDRAAPLQSARPNRSIARSKSSKTSSRAASKKKASRREAALAAAQTEQDIITGTSATTADSTS